ncbi:MAG: transposase [Verrucomicrobiales bacterium]|nr:transposase [Verrucomicrobiales bacterium]
MGEPGDVGGAVQVRVNTRGTGSELYSPSMLLSLLVYSYATGVFSSRRIEQSTHESVPARMVAGDSHPDHDTLCAFRRNNLALINESSGRSGNELRRNGPNLTS